MHHDITYRNLVDRIQKEGNHRGDRTGTGTQSLFGPQMEFDLINGFPLLTTKRMNFKAIWTELRWFLKGDTNTKFLVENDCNIWNEWSLTEEEFGQNFDGRPLITIEPVIKEDSGFYSPDSNLSLPASRGSLEDKLRGAWSKMMSRCYDKTAENYGFYGAKGIFVCERWHKLENFIEDVQQLPNWKHKLSNWNDYSLDKDYFSSNCYSPETCVWLSNAENALYGAANSVIATSPEGVRTIHASTSKCAEFIGVPKTSLHRWITGESEPKGKNEWVKGWSFEISDKPYRYGFPRKGDLGPVYGAQWRTWPAIDDRDGHIDQISELIDNLRNNPFSRRHIISGWNPALLPDESASHEDNIANGKQVLPPCHTMFQFYVHELTTLERIRYSEKQLGAENAGEMIHLPAEEQEAALERLGVPTLGLQCKLYQRSADMFLGVPYNIASYSLLTCLIAEMCDMAPTKFIHTFGDAHIYSNHKAQFEEQFGRAPKHVPFLFIDQRVRGYESVDQIEEDDVELVGYSSHPFIKAPVAI